MARSKGRRKQQGAPTGPEIQTKFQYATGRSDKSYYSMPSEELVGIRNAKLVTFPFSEVEFIGKSRVVIPDLSGYNFGSHIQGGAGAAAASSFIAEGAAQTGAAIFTYITDQLMRDYANLALLALGVTSTQFFAYVNTYCEVLAECVMLSSILNADGFNEITSTLALSMTSFRAGLREDFNRLNSLPMAPGVIDLVLRHAGYFAPYEGGPCILPWSATTIAIADLTNPANVGAILGRAASQLTTLMTDPTYQPIRAVLAKWFGDPIPLPAPGVRVSRSLFDSFRLMMWKRSSGTPVVDYSFPYIQNGDGLVITNPIINDGVPLMVPRGTKDPLWMTLLRPKPFGLFNNAQAGGDQGDVGFITSSLVGSPESMGVYSQANLTPFAVLTLAGALDGFNSPFNDFYYAPLTGAGVVGYGSDHRMQQDFVVFNVDIGTINSQTNETWWDIWADKRRIPNPSDYSEWNSQRFTHRKLM